MNNNASLFITLEGPDGCGKSTQANLLHIWLRSLYGSRVLLTREPGGCTISESIRAVLLQDCRDIEPITEALLFAAARAQHVRQTILPALDDGYIVICDRFLDSTIAYQGYGNEQSIDTLYAINAYATQGLKPDITFIFDLPVEIGLQRKRDKNRIDRKDVDFHNRVRSGYLEIAQNDPSRCIVLDATDPISLIHSKIMTQILFFVEDKTHDAAQR